MISVGPVPLFATTVGEIEYPIVRDMDTNMYERQHGGDLEVGSYAHRPILLEPDDIPSIAEAALSPTELPFTQDDFAPQMEHALELVPDILGDERVGIRHAINGLIALTPDGNPLLGETPEVKGLWSVAASWIKEAPGIAKHRRRVDDRREPPRSTRTAPTSRASTTTTGPRPTSGRAPTRASTRRTGSSTRWSSGRRTATSA